MKFKKIFKNLKYGVLKPKIFIILFGLFFSTLAYAATLTHTWIDGRIPAHNNSSCTSSAGDVMDKDSTEDPLDVAFSTDGLIVFSVNYEQEAVRTKGNLSMNRLSRPFDVSSSKRDNGDMSCDVIDAFRPGTLSGSEMGSRLRNIQVADNGKKFFMMSDNGKLGRFDLSTANEFSTSTFVGVLTFTDTEDNFALSTDGTKVFTLDIDANAPVITTYSLPGSYDVSSKTQIHQVDLTTIGVEDNTGNEHGRDIEFNDTGSAMFVLISNDAVTDGLRVSSFIYQYSLGKNFDVSTASLVGKYEVGGFGNVAAEAEGTGMPRGFVFSADGMRIYITNIQTGDGVDQINSFQLECPYGVVSCTSDSISSLASQLTLAKQNIALNTSTIFKRFEWVKRNRDSENLNSFNFNINSDDIILSSLTNKLQHLTTVKQISLGKNNKEDTKKSKWSYWSHADISIGDNRKTLLEKAQHFRAEGLTFGADKKYGDNKFFGLALRYSDNNNDIKGSAQRTEMESLTLNFYGVIPKDEDRYINAVLGLSALRFDQRYLDKLSGERNGKQIFTAINFRSKKTYGNFNISPSGKLTYGLTYFSEYTDFISNVKKGQNVLYDNDHFETGDLAAGFLFNTDEFKYPNGTFITNGGLEFVYDFTPVAELNYSNPGNSPVNVARLDNYSEQNIRGNIGFEFVYLSGFTVSMNYERYQSVNSIRNSHTDTLLIKFSHLIKEDSEFAFNFDPLKDNLAQLNYSKNINGFDVRFNTDYNLNSNIDVNGANIEVSSKF